MVRTARTAEGWKLRTANCHTVRAGQSLRVNRGGAVCVGVVAWLERAAGTFGLDTGRGGLPLVRTFRAAEVMAWEV